MIVEILGGVLALVGVHLAIGVRVVRQIERGVVFRLGRVRPEPKNPGMTLIMPLVDRLQKVNTQIVTMPIPAQDGITRDNVTVESTPLSTSGCGGPRSGGDRGAGLPLCGRAGRPDLAAFHHRQERARRLAVQSRATQQRPGNHDRQPGAGVGRPHRPSRDQGRRTARRHEAVDVAAAEAERERRARVIVAEGEFQASEMLAQAAAVMADTPGALQLRLLETVVEVAAEKNSTLVLPFPIELLRFLEKASGEPAKDHRSVESAPGEDMRTPDLRA